MLNWSPDPMMYSSEMLPSPTLPGSFFMGATSEPPLGGPRHPVRGMKMVRPKSSAPIRKREFTIAPHSRTRRRYHQRPRYQMMSSHLTRLIGTASAGKVPPQPTRASERKEGRNLDVLVEMTTVPLR